MSRRFSVDHSRLSQAEFSQALADSGLGLKEFCRLTGARMQHVKAWLKPDDSEDAIEPPFWVTSWFTLYRMPGADVLAKAVSEAHIVPPGSIDDHDAEYAIHA